MTAKENKHYQFPSTIIEFKHLQDKQQFFFQTIEVGTASFPW